MAKTRIALIGLGMAVTPHAKGLLDLKDRVEVAYAFSPSAKRREAFLQRPEHEDFLRRARDEGFEFPLCNRLETILEDPRVEVVAILTPSNTHFELASRCAAAGKHVLLEKPVETTTARAVKLVEACRKAGVKLGIVLQHRFRPAGMKLSEILISGELGAILGCSTVIRLWRPQTYYDEPGRGTMARDGGGVLISQGIHTLDLMLSLAGPIEEVFGYVTATPVHRMETEDLVCAAARFKNGALGTIDATTAAYPGFPERIEFICRNGTASIAGGDLAVRFHDGRKIEESAEIGAGGTGANPMDFSHEFHRAVMADFLDAIQSGREPKVTGEEALRVHRLIDALIETGAKGAPVKVAAG